ncbi:proclotting enzyme-like isoform X2 [Anoplophora glabripennis]|uniref:proclotting enzyme-like isoform X2 n=1 Tax=Anoplophora glabripennis TaxID=217634 RepID=UPI0008736C87|nr:proclotting enzyme-like isoform X2 [Anoplophora glabripennis]
MGLTLHLSLCLLVIATTLADDPRDDDPQSVTIEADPSEDHNRDGRQFVVRSPTLPVYNPFLVPQIWNNVNVNNRQATTGPCFTSKGVLGKCTSFRQCYPYFKMPEVSNFDNWVLGMYDTCSYFTSQGRQMFGVCCATSPKPTSPADSASTEEPTVEQAEGQNELSKKPYYPSWPPPLPTHPPDHTIPPLPTHPPSPGFPTQSPGVWPPTIKPITTKPPKKPATTKPSYKPPSAKPPTVAIPVTGGSCGAKNGYQDQERIVGGHNADVNEWPWIAALFNGGRQFCGGSLIDNIHILSAAHCVAHMSSWDVARLTVKLGDHNIRTNSEINHVEKRVKRVVRHRGFDSRTLYNDIAILTLDSPVDFTQQIRPVCLPNGGNDHSGKTATVIGWGSLRESGPQPAILQEVNIPIWSNRDCKLKYGPAAPGGIVEHMLCAGQANRDSCSGDSGGPLMVNNGKWTQVGIVSWGIGCGKGQYPGVYTRVEKFLPWIYKNLK